VAKEAFMSDDHTLGPEPQSNGFAGSAAIRDRDDRPCHPSLHRLVHHPGLQMSAQVNAGEDEPSRTAPDPDERKQTLREEVVWSVALIGVVVAYLGLMVHLAS
jgi:hypothetical protein